MIRDIPISIWILQGRDMAGQRSAGHLSCAIPTRFSMFMVGYIALASWNFG